MQNWILIAICIMGWGAWALFEKMALKTMSPSMAQILGSSIFMIYATCMLGYMKSTGEQIKVTTQGVLFIILATICSFVSNIAYLNALKRMEPAYVTGVTSSYPVFTLLLCALFFREPITIMNFIGIIAIVIGTVLVSLQ